MRLHHHFGLLMLLSSLLASAVVIAGNDRPPPPPDITVDAAGREALVRDVLQALDQKFVFPERMAQHRPELVRRWSSDTFKAMTSARQLTAAINGDLAELFHDKHLSLHRRREGAPLPPAGDAAPSAAELAEMERQEAQFHYGVRSVEVLDGNIGYVRIDAFPDVHLKGMSQAISDAMSFVADTRALILDLRQNHGGDGDTVAVWMSYLLESKKLLLRSWDRTTGKTTDDWTLETVPGRRYGAKRPLWVLTSSESFSAAEELAYDVQTLQRGKLVGETTGGAANHNEIVPVGKSFVLSVPIAKVTSPVTHTNWEGVGVRPDVAVAREQALEVAVAAAHKTLAAKK